MHRASPVTRNWVNSSCFRQLIPSLMWFTLSTFPERQVYCEVLYFIWRRFMCLFCDVALEGKANWISVSCPLKAEVLMLLINLSRNHLPHICTAQTGFSASAEGSPLSEGLIMTFSLESRWYLPCLEPKPLIVPKVLVQNRWQISFFFS